MNPTLIGAIFDVSCEKNEQWKRAITIAATFGNLLSAGFPMISVENSIGIQVALVS